MEAIVLKEVTDDSSLKELVAPMEIAFSEVSTIDVVAASSAPASVWPLASFWGSRVAKETTMTLVAGAFAVPRP